MENNIFSSIDWSNITSVENLFRYSGGATNDRIKNLNWKDFPSSRITNMSNMFQSCLLKNNNFMKDINTKNVKDFSHMFSNWDMSTGTGIQGNFFGVKNNREASLNLFDFSLLDFTSAETVEGMFGLTTGSNCIIDHDVTLDFHNCKVFDRFLGGFIFEKTLTLKMNNPTSLQRVFTSLRDTGTETILTINNLQIEINSLKDLTTMYNMFNRSEHIKQCTFVVNDKDFTMAGKTVGSCFWFPHYAISGELTCELEYLDIRDFDFSKSNVKDPRLLICSTASWADRATSFKNNCVLIVKNDEEREYWKK